jgi:hypothetical protein
MRRHKLPPPKKRRHKPKDGRLLTHLLTHSFIHKLALSLSVTQALFQALQIHHEPPPAPQPQSLFTAQRNRRAAGVYNSTEPPGTSGDSCLGSSEQFWWRQGCWTAWPRAVPPSLIIQDKAAQEDWAPHGGVGARLSGAGVLGSAVPTPLHLALLSATHPWLTRQQAREPWGRAQEPGRSSGGLPLATGKFKGLTSPLGGHPA